MRQNVYKNTKLVLCWPSLRVGQTLQCDPSIQWDSFGETRLCFADGCQLEMASGLRIEACVQFPSQLWEPPPGWSLCRPCVSPRSRGFMCVSACCVGDFWSSVSLVSSIPSGYYNTSVFYSALFPELRGKASDEGIPFKAKWAGREGLW